MVLDSDVIMGNGEDEKYLMGIDLDIDGIVIDGAGHVIDAGWKSAIFNVTCNATVKNATIKSGYSHDEDAYAIMNSADLSFFGCTLKDNPTAIMSEGSLKVTGCKFTDFVRRYNDALYNKNGNLAVDGCSFIDEKVGWSPHGQAIINNGYLKLVNSYFKMIPLMKVPYTAGETWTLRIAHSMSDAAIHICGALFI